MPRLQLQPHVRFAIIDDRPVFLDLRRDRYFVLEGAASSAFDAMRSDAGHALDAPAAARLLATGLFRTSTPPAELSPVTMSPAQREPPASPAPAFAPMDVIEIGWLVRQARRSLGSEPLEKLIEGCRRTTHQCSARASDERIAMLARRFRRARAWVPIRPSCLQDSLAFHRWLARRRASADLVIGVKLNPFAAHCWLQVGHVVLNDSPERVAAFTPILTA